METGHTDFKSVKAQEVAGALSATAKGRPTIYLQLTSLKALKRRLSVVMPYLAPIFRTMLMFGYILRAQKRYSLPALTPVLQISFSSPIRPSQQVLFRKAICQMI